MERTISVRGRGRLALRPDTAEVAFLVASRDKNYARAMAEQERLGSALNGALRSLGFEEEDIKTASFSVNAMHDSVCVDGEYRSVFVGYCAEHRMLLRFPLDTEKLGEVLSAISGCIAEPELNVSFTVSDPEAASTELLSLAAKDARAKAEALASAFGCGLGALVRIDHGGDAPLLYSPTNYDCRMMSAKAEAASFNPMDIDAGSSALFVWELA